MLEEYCRTEIYRRCAERIPSKPIVSLKGKPIPPQPFENFMVESDRYNVHNGTFIKRYLKSPAHSPIRQAMGFFSREGGFLCDHMINDSFHGSWTDAMTYYGTFNAMFNGFKDYFAKRKEMFMEETTNLIQEQTGALPKALKTPHSHGGVANLLKVLTKTMQEQGSNIRTIAKVQYAICTQAGIYIPEEFITDVLVAVDIAPEIVGTLENTKAREAQRLKDEYQRKRN